MSDLSEPSADANDLDAMEHLPEPQRTSTALAAVDMMRRVTALVLARHNALLREIGKEPINNWRFNSFELQNAHVWGPFAILALLIVPHDLCARDQCERIEKQTFYDCEGRVIFTQWIGWDDNVFFWRLDKPEANIGVTQHGRQWCLRFTDGDLYREVWAKSFDVTHGQVDVEVENRAVLPVEQRRRLKGAK